MSQGALLTTMAAGLVALQQFETIAGRNCKIIETPRRVHQSQLPLHAAPPSAT